MYALGIDLGTTVTAAAVWRDGRGRIVALGVRSSLMPSVVFLEEDGSFLAGEAARRRGAVEPHRAAREFVRRLGDPTPIMLGGAPHSAEQLTARLLRAVVDQVAEQQGAAPSAVCLSHPADWGPYKTDLLRQAVEIDPPMGVSYVTEPEAATAFYAQQERIAPESVVAVYDLGGGTFDAAVLRNSGPVGVGEFELLGRPERIERLGGTDFDTVVFGHVAGVLGARLAELDEDDPAVVAALARLREECTKAKEALSYEVAVAIPVLLPNVSTEVWLTRDELEAMIRPRLAETIEALGRALTSAEVSAEELHSVLLIGGSSRIPLVGQLVAAELGRPAVAVHAQAVAEGAAWLAGRHLRHAVVHATAPSPPRVPDHAPDAALPPSHVAVPDVAGRRGGSRPRTKAVTASDPISRAVRTSISMGLIAFNPPHRMRQGHGERVEVEIARSLQLRDEIARGLRGRGDPVVEEIRTSQFMGVQLLGHAFYIDELSPREQLVPSMARWEFNVTPKRIGNQVLILCATMMIQTSRGDGLIAVPVLERDVDVQVDVRYGAKSFISHNWQWLTATCIGLGGAISAWATLIR